jgi:O-antigen/teichoic acid export membrane protein
MRREPKIPDRRSSAAGYANASNQVNVFEHANPPSGRPQASSVAAVLLRGVIWNIGPFLVGQALRVVSNVVLARLLSPSLFGITTIVYTFKTGVELISDIGPGQNIVSSPNSDNPKFYNTIFTFQVLRGALLWLALSAAAPFLAEVYKIPEMLWIIPVAGIGSFIAGFTSPAREFLRKWLHFRELGIMEIAVSSATYLTLIALALISPTVWSLVIGAVLSSVFATCASYFLRAGLRLRFQIRREFAPEILHYGKWIFLTSLAYFLSTYYDRLFFAKFVPLSVLGVYGIARSIADLISGLTNRLGMNVLFPYIASTTNTSREALRRKFSPVRLRFIAVNALGLAVLAVGSDLIIRILYDRRYHDATWLLPVLVLGSWFSILANINESALLGLGKPSYGALSNVAKLLFLFVGLPMGFSFNGLLGATAVVAFADVPKILILQIGQRRERFSFARQDVAATLAMFALVITFEATRWTLGYGTSFDTLPRLIPAR